MLKISQKKPVIRSGPNPVLGWSHAATAASIRTTLSCLGWTPC